MAISLVKGQNVNLNNLSPSLRHVNVGLGWDVRASTGAAFDLDASVFMINESGKVPAEEFFVFFNNLKSKDSSVVHMGDNLTGAGDGDDELIKVDLNSVSPEIKSLQFVVTIYDALSRRQNFGQVQNAYVRIVNDDTNEEIVRFDLTEDYSTETGMIFGELYRHNGDWKFRAIGQGETADLGQYCQKFGV